MRSRLPVSEYPRQWAEYNRRWYAAWTIPLALVLITLFALDHRAMAWGLIIACLAYALLYTRFIRWPCPRCGYGFTKPNAYSMYRANCCKICGLRRNAHMV